MNRRVLTFIRSYSGKWPRPVSGSSERPPYYAPDPLVNNPNAAVKAFDDLTFIHRPPPTAPSPFSYTTNPASPLLRPPTLPVDAPLPPLIRPSAEKIQPPRVTEEVKLEIRRLRLSKPEHYTRGKLAKQFGVTQQFVALVAALPKSKRRAAIKVREQKHEKARESWSEKRSMVKAIRARRREFW